jgi:hypothetical protein
MSAKRVRIGRDGRVPDGAVDVSRRTPFRCQWPIMWVRNWLRSVNVAPHKTLRRTREVCVDNYRSWLRHGIPIGSEAHRDWVLSQLPDLRGKNLACFCPLDQPCHADVLLEMANNPGRQPVQKLHQFPN